MDKQNNENEALSVIENNSVEGNSSIKNITPITKQLKLKRLSIILLSILIASCAFYIYQLWSYANENERSANFFERSIVASINQYEYLPALLAKDDLVINLLKTPINNHEILSNKLEFTTLRSKASDIFLLDTSGKVVATSNFKQEKSFFNKNYAFRPYFQKALTEKTRQFYFAKGVTTGIPGFFISSPVIQAQKVIGVMVVKLYLSEWENSWSESKDNILVADANNIIVLSSDDKWRYQSIGKLTDDKLLEIYTTKQFPNETHLPIYSDTYSYKLGSKEIDFWKTESVNYVVSNFIIEDTNWTFYHLVKHSNFLSKLLMFISLLSLLGLTLYFFLNERTHKLFLKELARENEKKRHYERQTLIDNIHIGVIVHSKEGLVLSMNEHAQDLLINKASMQISADKKPIQYNIDDLLDIDLNIQNIERYIQTDSVSANAYNETTSTIFHTENNISKKIPIIFSIAEVHYADRDALLMTVIDITRRKKVEDELITLNESLEEKVNSRSQELKDIQNVLIQKNKTVALGNMAATIVHELSQPLSAMNSSVGALLHKMDKENWQGAGESAERLLPLSNKMKNVINLLKFFSYQDENIDEVIDLNQSVNQSIEILKDTLREKNITLVDQLSDTSILIKINPLKLDLVISNLLKNAIDALETRENPSIQISSDLINDKSDPIVILHIEDNGIGVDEHIMGQLFNPYFTTKEVGKGMGLGLSITYEIVKQYGGDINAENTDSGAKFSITLPIQTD
ncbi:MAG: two-component system C4-dicarboxylate transport sensor histidine kinase DctB [Cocleimonas sp.]|jgi:two-component system C4-dicarboxylate transport sensor histidine kinase DctB